MMIYYRDKKIDTKEFEVEKSPRNSKYGLPENVAFCNKCVISNQRPNSAVEYTHTKYSKKTTINIDEEGVCDACRYAEKKNETIDWSAREKELSDLCDKFRRDDGSYDCLLPGSGGKDSFFAAHILKYKYKMHPLTVSWAPHLYTEWGWRNFQRWIHSGLDNILYTPNGLVHRLLTRLAIENLFHPFQPFIIGQKALAPKVALQYGIKLVFYGENEAEYGNPIQDNENAKRNWSYFTMNEKKKAFLAGTSIADLTSEFGVEPVDLCLYMPVDPDAVNKAGVEVHYLGYYLRWHPQRCYFYAVENGGFEASPERTPGTYSKYNSIDDKIDDLHYYTTFIKFGIGRATYDASQEIRSGDITREEGVALVRRFDGEFPERFFDELLEYLSLEENHFPVASKLFEKPIMDREYFHRLTDRFRSPHLWKLENGQWILRHRVWDKRYARNMRQEDEAIQWQGNRYRPFHDQKNE
jgi:N-acetyl sugar amidotransferase